MECFGTISILFVHGKAMLAMEGKIVLPMHTAILCEKEEVNIQQKMAYINRIGTHLCRHHVCYVLLITTSQLAECYVLPPSQM